MKISSKYILVKLDRIDKNIIRALQNNGRMQNNDLAREIGLSPSSCLRRVKLLEEAGVIQNYTAVVDPQKIGFQLLLFSRIWLVGQDAETIDSFIEAMKELPQVMECYIILGECDAMLKVVVPRWAFMVMVMPYPVTVLWRVGSPAVQSQMGRPTKERFHSLTDGSGPTSGVGSGRSSREARLRTTASIWSRVGAAGGVLGLGVLSVGVGGCHWHPASSWRLA